ncbi:MAG: hypothetical protein J4F46_09285 [Dehalococcoidia bacterium]|nr:hypothetical protein [Dehalococcoidia bacterium]
MIVALCIFSHLAVLAIADDRGGVEMAFLLAIAGIVVGTAVSAGTYRSWYQKTLWLIAYFVAIIALPYSLEVCKDLLKVVPEALRDLWLVVTWLSVPVGMFLGVITASWRSRSERRA